MDIYVLVDAKTGKFWKKKSPNGRRGVYAFLSEDKARATLKMFHPQPEDGEVEIKRYTNNETSPDNSRGSDR